MPYALKTLFRKAFPAHIIATDLYLHRTRTGVLFMSHTATAPVVNRLALQWLLNQQIFECYPVVKEIPPLASLTSG